jgi:hypothetical protein
VSRLVEANDVPLNSADVAMPIAIQNTKRKASGPMSAATGMPRISTTTSARPIVPAKIGV